MRVAAGLMMLILTGAVWARPAHTVTVQPAKHLRAKLALWPLIANPTTPAEKRINRALRGLNQQLRQDVQECSADWVQYRRHEGEPISSKNDNWAWERKVRITMRGPHYLSIVAEDVVIVCNGSYPNHDLDPLVFDLDRGALVSWAFLTGNSEKRGEASECPNSCQNDTIDSPMLDQMSKVATSDGCKEVFDSAQVYQIWPDTRKGVLIAHATGLPHVTQGCAEDLPLSSDQARKLGFNESFLAALDQAHRAWVSTNSGVKTSPKVHHEREK